MRSRHNCKAESTLSDEHKSKVNEDRRVQIQGIAHKLHERPDGDQEFGVKIEDEDARGLRNLNDVVEYFKTWFPEE
ncbi:hypothetical protein BDV34DRAFT_230523 [Aspergillus parasiticus]|uniref:Uncharacterized protein n=1 Tax=Aspergillus parasiticus TaxID=5067 RepID=A0A5N6D541_ASPPA|nr:hypothetical protein BDV34DRAFT_230523 [Aspergillus parasiticus]